MENYSTRDDTTRPPRRSVRVRLILPQAKERWEALMQAQHYLGFAGFIGPSLRYAAEADGRWFALLGWQAAALKCRARDRWIGWPVVGKSPRRYAPAPAPRGGPCTCWACIRPER